MPRVEAYSRKNCPDRKHLIVCLSNNTAGTASIRTVRFYVESY